MANVTVEGSIKVTWPEGQSSYSPGNPEELALIAVQALVKELGSEYARDYIGQLLERLGEHHPHSRG